jgi:glycosyltransferase involved in cell wall biosynthesis
MFNFKKDSTLDPIKKKILWVTFLVLDAQLHKTSQFEILSNFAKKGYDTNLISIRSKKKFGNKKSQISIFAIPLRNVPLLTSFIFAIFLFLFLPFYILATSPGFIIIQPTIPIVSFIPAIFISKIKKIKLILDIRTITIQTGYRGAIHDFIFTTSILMAKQLFDGITIITEAMKKEISIKYVLDANKLGVWSSGVSPLLFNPENWLINGKKIRQQLGLIKKFVVFYHGALSPNRGLIETIKAINLLKKKYPQIILFLLGSGPLTFELKQLIEKLRLKDFVIVHDAVEYEDVPKYISMSNVGIIPLPDIHFWRFQSPLKLLEYLSMKKVVIISDIPAHRAVVGREKCGIFVSAIKPIEISKSIIFAIKNQDKLSEWGAIGRSIIQREYTWGDVANSLEDYLLSIS